MAAGREALPLLGELLAVNISWGWRLAGGGIFFSGVVTDIVVPMLQ